MGPNLYITPARAFTHLHQDGHGTVDSGHQCLTGYNEVVMLRRLDEVHMKVGLARGARRRRPPPAPLTPHPLQDALNVMRGEATEYDALYDEPHNAGAKPHWPTALDVAALREAGYCPSVFTLEPGEYVTRTLLLLLLLVLALRPRP